jgi:type I restriction enzyme M protein
MPRADKKSAAPLTTAQSLGSLLKSARDIMRKDKGLSGDLDRLPMLTWIMFLKFLDDLEQTREQEAVLAGRRFRPAIEPPYRWRDWAADPQGITGDELLAFVNQDEALGPDGRRGPGLFAYLRGLSSANGDARRDVIATVFKGVDNRMRSGYLLRDVINKVNGIHFTASDELHTLGALYESMLREMRDAAGDSGEFYTPRAVVRLMVKLVDPQIGESVLDPAAGTGGFLVEAFEHMRPQANSVEKYRQLQERTLFGFEPKPLPYLLCQMNLLLHGVESPWIDPGNALAFKLTEIGEKERLDVILTNPPFGGEEEKGIQGNFPEDRQTAETALLFLQVIMRRLHRAPTPAGRPARAAVVVPNGMLFGDGVCARIKEELLADFDLHTIVRLPNGVFAPYTSIPTNLLFFERGGPTREVWYYGHALPEGRKNYTKTAPLQFDEFKPLLDWWRRREESERAWRVPADEIRAANFNLDRKNPNARQDITHLPPEELVAGILDKERQIIEIMHRVQALLREGGA